MNTQLPTNCTRTPHSCAEHHRCKCSCRQMARQVVNILKRAFPDERTPRVRLSLEFMRECGATPKNLKDLYYIHTHISEEHPYLLGNFEDMLELLFLTRKSEIVETITRTMKEYAARKGVEIGTLINSIGDPEHIVQFLQEHRYVLRYKPGVLYSLYEWGKLCSCCKRHRRNFPEF